MNYALSKLAIGLATVLAFAGQANADQAFNLGTLAVNSSAALAGNVKAGSFTDSFYFTVANSSVNAAITSISYGLVGISDLNISLFQGSTPLLSGFSQTIQVVPGVNLSGAGFLPYSISAGDYTLQVTGIGSSQGGSFGGNLNVVAVPEPTESALMLSGIALLGFIAARRKSV